MTYKAKQIKHEASNFWVLETDDLTHEVYQKGITHSTRVAIIGYKGELGLTKAITECTKRQTAWNL